MTETTVRPSLLPTLGVGILSAALASAITLVAAPKLIGEKLVRSALTEHPELLVEAGEALRSRQFAQAIAPIRASLERPYHSSWRGAANPKVTLVYFFDYACGYCRQANPVVDRLIKENSDLRVVYRELPILGAQSVVAARVSLAASQAGKFNEFHDAMYAAGRPGPDTIAQAAAAVGLPAMPVSDPAQDAELNSNGSMASQLGATGTPLFVIGNEVHNAAVPFEVLNKAVAAARKG